MSFRILFKSAIVSLLVAAAGWAQEYRGTVAGVVTDPSGAVVVGVQVTVTEVHTGTKIPAVTDSAGQYTAPYLLPGDYDISAQMPGFKGFVRKWPNCPSTAERRWWQPHWPSE